jgi:hypothetical protein
MVDVTAPGRELHRRFTALGDMTGKTEREIELAVCSPNAISSMDAGKRLLQWQATGYHIAILFGPDHRFLKITHESVHHTVAPPEDSPLGIILGILFALLMIGGLISRIAH